ncbi:Small acidic protein [Sorochytrium milnesiophthora]
MSASEKRKLLWAGKKAMPEEEKAQAPPAKTVNQWETTQFAGDADGARKQKFLSLMGLKKPGNAATATSASQDDAPKSIKRQSEVLDDLERQFDAGRSQQNFGRGRGLGY